MSVEKNNTPYAEPPPPYSNNFQGGYVPQTVSPNIAMFPGPIHPPPAGGVPVYPMAGSGYPTPPPTLSHQSCMVGSQSGVQPMTSVTVVNVAECGPYPMQINCPHCGAHVMTETTALPGLLTYLLSGGMILLGCWIGCCLIPCCIPECQNIEHKCPNCKQHINTYRRM